MLTRPANTKGPYCTNSEDFIKNGECKKCLELLEQFKNLEELKHSLIDPTKATIYNPFLATIMQLSFCIG